MSPEERLFLIVDDEPDMCWALEHLLNQQGLLSRKALNGQEALRLLEDQAFCMALVDAKLPDMDGLELARRMRELAPSMRILIVSGYFYRHDPAIQEAIAEGLIWAFISKPFKHEEILQLLLGNSFLIPRENPP